MDKQENMSEKWQPGKRVSTQWKWDVYPKAGMNEAFYRKIQCFIKGTHRRSHFQEKSLKLESN